jgi:hypothetical protein
MVYASLSIGSYIEKPHPNIRNILGCLHKKSRKLLLPTHENYIEFRADKKKEVLY